MGGGGLAKWLKYYMITVYHDFWGNGVYNKYQICEFDKKLNFFFMHVKFVIKIFGTYVKTTYYNITLGGRANWLHYYIWGVAVCPNDYNITWGVSLGTQKSDYVIYV